MSSLCRKVRAQIVVYRLGGRFGLRAIDAAGFEPFHIGERSKAMVTASVRRYAV
jgi:hypothetical protein